MDAEIITLGNELLLGRTIDTNATWLAQWLDEKGFRVVRKITIGDDPIEIENTIRKATERATLVVATGGLGPTHDDVTRNAIARAFGVEVRRHPDVMEVLDQLYRRRGRPFSEDRQTMADVPDGFGWLRNPIGSAPGLIWKSTGPNPKCFLALPGVPYEMRSIVETHAEEEFAFLGTRGSAHETFRTAGVTENQLHELLEDVIDRLPAGVSIAFLPDPVKGVAVRVSARAANRGDAVVACTETAGAVRDAIGKYTYGGEGDRLEAVVGELLRRTNRTLALAESCTGGLIGDRITDVPGSSDYFRGGLVVYGNEPKIKLLGVSEVDLQSDGAVSKVVAEQMAEGCRTRFGADLGISVTGIAGPTGGTAEKPVGTVWIGLADGEASVAFHLRFTDDRRLNKELASTAALNLLRRKLCKIIA